MFAQAYKLASCFTYPVVITTRFFDNTVECGCGAFVIINDEGWIITVGHLWDSWLAFQRDGNEIDDYKKDIQNIQQDQKLTEKSKHKKIKQLKTNSKWLTNHSFWWGRDGVVLQDIRRLPEGDLVIGRLDPFDPKSVESYPVFKNPT